MFFDLDFEPQPASTSWAMDLNGFFSGQPSSSSSTFHLDFSNFPNTTHPEPKNQSSPKIFSVDFGEEDVGPVQTSRPSVSGFREDSIETAISREIPDYPDYQAYEHFDKLWMSSKHHESILKSQWDCLVERVRKQQTVPRIKLTTGAHVTTLFHICRELKTNFVVRFRAVELYERYLFLFSEKMEDYLNSSSEEDVQVFFERYQAQILLRICTCILIASKLHADTQLRSLRAEEIRVILQTQGFKYTSKSICRSEMRVLETLDYRCHWATPMDLIEQLLCILTLNLPIFQRTHYFCILLLEFCYSDWEKIRYKFCSAPNRTPGNHQITIPLQCASIVAAGLFIVSAESKEKNDLHKRVAQKADLQERDVQDLAVIILDLLNEAS